MTVAELRNAQRSLERAQKRAEDARLARDEAVRQALSEGWTHARISEATGLTRGRIGQLAARQ